MKKIISVFCAVVLILTTVIIAVPSAAAEVVPPEGQDATLASTIVCSSKPTTVMNYTNNATRRSIATISKLTYNDSMRALGYKTYNGFSSSMNSTHNVAAFDFPAGTVVDENGGYMFYLDLPVLNSYADKDVPLPHVIAVQRHTASGAVASYTLSLAKNDGISWYVLPDGEKQWQECNEWVTFGENPYGLKLSDGTKPFRGYVYVPAKLLQKNGYLDKSGYEIGSISIIVDVDRKTYGGAGDGRGSERGVAPMDVSAISLISSFKADTTCVYNDYGKLVDLAEEEDKNLAKLPFWEDENGDPTNLHGTAEKIPANITSHNFKLTENTSGLPLTSLFSYTLPEGKETMNAYIGFSETVSPDVVKGAIFYVEIPEFDKVSYTFDKGTEDTSDDVTRETDKFRLALTFSGYDYQRNAETGLYEYNTNGSIKTKNRTFLTYGAPDWYIRSVDDQEWKLSGDKTYYGVGLPSGFKGYVCIPFNALTQNNYAVSTDSFITGFSVTQLTNSESKVFREAHNTSVPEYGYIPDDKPLVISEPIWMSGNYMDGADEFVASDEITINDVDYNYSTGKVKDFSENPTNLSLGKAFKTYSATLDGAESPYANGKRTIVPSTSLLTSKDGTYMTGVRHYDSKIDAETAPGRGYFPDGTLFSELTSNTNSGFLFHVDMPALDEGQTHHLTVTMVGTNSGGTANTRYLDNAVGGTQVVYLLKDGASAWETRTEGVEGEWYNAYQPIVSDGTQPWNGYVFVPKDCMNNWGSGIYNLQEVIVGAWVSRHSNKTPNTSDKHVGVSAVSMVNGFDPTTTVMYGDDNRIVNLATGEFLDLNYSESKEYVGKQELINNGSATIIGLENLPLKDVAIAGNAVSSSTATSGSLAASARFVKSTCAITGQPAINLKGDVTTARAQTLQFDIPNVRAGDIDGFMFYVKTGEKPVSIGFNAATTITKEGGATATYYNNAYGYASTLPLLAKGATAWTNTKAQTPINGVSQIPANFEGYMYLPKFSSMNSVVGGLVDPDETLIWRLNFYMAAADDGDENTTDDMAVDFSFIPFTVAKGTFTKNYVGKAFVNGSSIAQNVFSGDFVVPNDNDGNMKIDLLDLVRAKETQNTSDFASFRTSYLENYFRETKTQEYIPVTYDKIMQPLYADEYEALMDNPDRGFRTEMVIGIQEKYDEGETTDARSLYTTDSEAKIRETMNQIFEIYFPTNAENHSKLVLAFISFKDWNKSEYLPQEVLDVLEIFFEYLRKYEVRVLLRFAYGVPTNLYIANEADREKLEKVCADEATMIRHIKQLSPFVGKHRDVVHKISSGWIGNGEMVASFQWPAVNFDNIVRAVVENMCVPNNLYFTVRLPRYKVDMLNNYKAANGTDYPYADIIGFNNDAIYGEQTHTGHNSGCYQYNHVNCGKNCFQNQANYFDEWQYGIKTAAYTPQCGEMFTNESLMSTGRNPSGLEVMLEMAHHRYTGFSQWHGYLDTSGYKADGSNVISLWINNESYSARNMEEFGIIYDPNSFVQADGTEVTLNPYVYLRDHLGYKLVASNTSLKWSGNHNDSATVSLSFKNYGFAAPFTLESGFAILDENYNVVYKVKEGNPDKWYSLDPDFYTEDFDRQGAVVDSVLDYELNAKLSVPSESGKYYVAFYLQNELGEGARLSNDIEFEKEFNILHEITVE